MGIQRRTQYKILTSQFYTTESVPDLHMSPPLNFEEPWVTKNYELNSNILTKKYMKNSMRAYIVDWKYFYILHRPSLCCLNSKKCKHCHRNIIVIEMLCQPSTLIHFWWLVCRLKMKKLSSIKWERNKSKCVFLLSISNVQDQS